MLVLSIDTTTRAGSIAVVDNERVRSELVGDLALTHGERLPRDVTRALEVARARLEEIDLLAVAAGPGSFTGLRVGIACAQGIAMATTRRIVPVSALEALARAGANYTAPVGAWMDAQRGQVFAALYDATGTRIIIEASALAPDETLAHWRNESLSAAVRFIGDGAVTYAGIIRDRLGPDATIIRETPPLAGIIGLMASRSPERAVPPHAVMPIYVRRPDAELARNRRGGER